MADWNEDELYELEMTTTADIPEDAKVDFLDY